jgi:hypothetical protein
MFDFLVPGLRWPASSPCSTCGWSRRACSRSASRRCKRHRVKRLYTAQIRLDRGSPVVGKTLVRGHAARRRRGLKVESDPARTGGLRHPAARCRPQGRRPHHHHRHPGQPAGICPPARRQRSIRATRRVDADAPAERRRPADRRGGDHARLPTATASASAMPGCARASACACWPSTATRDPRSAGRPAWTRACNCVPATCCWCSRLPNTSGSSRRRRTFSCSTAASQLPKHLARLPLALAHHAGGRHPRRTSACCRSPSAPCSAWLALLLTRCLGWKDAMGALSHRRSS